MVGYYNECKDNKDTKKTTKKLRFMLESKLEDKFYDILENIKEKSNIANIDYVYVSPTKGDEYLKTTVSDNTLFDIDNSRIISSRDVKFLCNVLLQIQSVFHSTKDKDKDVVYIRTVLL